MHTPVYLGLDAHKGTCTLAGLDSAGDVVFARTFSTSESSLRDHVNRIRAKTKWLALEESTLSGWIAGVLRPHVDRLIVCDSVHNTFISRGGNKDDVTDAIKLCRLLRLDELKEVYHSDSDHRVDFKRAVLAHQPGCVPFENTAHGQVSSGGAGLGNRNPSVHEEASRTLSERVAKRKSAEGIFALV